MKCYKVVTVDKGRYYSSFAEEILKKRYFTNKYTETNKSLVKKGYGICCFSRMKDVVTHLNESLISYYSPYQVWEAEGIFVISSKKMAKKRMGAFWETPIPTIKSFLNLAKTRTFSMGWPKGTIMFEKIKLIKKVI